MLTRVNWNGERARTLLCAFILPCVLTVTVFAAIGIFPFGEKSLLIIDMNSEYVDYLAQMNESVRTGGSLLRSWNMGMGLNMLGLIAFYTASPFNLLVLLFPVQYITEVLFVVTVLKIGLAGLLFALFTQYSMGRSGLFAVGFAVAYALCAYNIAYASNIMWLDGAAFLPLVLLGVQKLLREDKCAVLIFAFAYVFFSSYYIGYMIGVFASLFFLAEWASQNRAFRDLWGKLARFVGSAALAAGCCAFLLLPAFFNLRHGQAEMFTMDLSPVLDKSVVHMLARMLPGVYDTLTDDGYPNIYCSVMGLLLCAVYFAHKWVPRRHKLVYGGLLGFLLLSFSCRALYLAFHAFEDPTWFPARYSFVFCFLVLYLAMHAATRLDSLPVSAMLGAGGLLLVLIVEIGIGRYRHVGMKNLLAGGALIVAYSALWALWRWRGCRWAAPVVLVLVCAEVWCNALVMEWELDAQFQYRTRESYTSYREEYTPLIDMVARQDTGVYRIENVEQRNANGGMALGYNGISHYSTTTDQALNALLRALGYNKGTDNELRFACSTPLTNGLLGIKYVFSRHEMGGGYELRYADGGVGVYENRCAFPLAFWADMSGQEWPPEQQDNPFALQNRMMESLGVGDSFFTEVPDVDYTLHNTDREEQQEGYLLLTPLVRSEPAVVEYRVHNPEQREVFAFFPVWNNRFSGADILVDGALVQQDLRYRKNAIVPMGSGESIDLVLNLGKNSANLEGEYFYHLDVEGAARAAQAAGENAVQFDRFSDTSVSGTVTAPRDGVIVSTFPLDSGWSVRLDGRTIEPQSFAGVFMAIPVGAGEHGITMRYRSPGFIPGCWISAGCVVGTAAYRLWRRKKHTGAIESADNP